MGGKSNQIFTRKMAEQIIVGIDPGTNILGYGVIKVNGSQISLLEVGILHMQKEPDAYKKLRTIYSSVDKLVKQFKPAALAIEAPFFGKNVQSMLKLGRAQGVAIAAAVSNDVSVEEFSPRKIKQSITGNGNATKEQVSAMICRMLKLNEAPAFFDESDALAVAICYHLQNKPLLKLASSSSAKGKSAKSSSWAAFIKENPDRTKKP